MEKTIEIQLAEHGERIAQKFQALQVEALELGRCVLSISRDKLHTKIASDLQREANRYLRAAEIARTTK